jgi:hypothetical protein
MAFGMGAGRFQSEGYLATIKREKVKRGLG